MIRTVIYVRGVTQVKTVSDVKKIANTQPEILMAYLSVLIAHTHVMYVRMSIHADSVVKNP